MRLHLFVAYLGVIFLSCQEEKGKPIIGVDKIVITNRTNLSLKFDSVVVYDSNLIRNIVSQYNQLKSIPDSLSRNKWNDPITRNSYGTWDVSFYSGNKNLYDVQIMFTVFNGVVMIQGRALFKNDDFQVQVNIAVEKLMK